MKDAGNRGGEADEASDGMVSSGLALGLTAPGAIALVFVRVFV